MKHTRPRPYPNLKSWRTAQGLNQRDAADLLGISQTLYARLERGAQCLKGDRLADLMQKTGVPLEVLAGVA